MAKRTGVKITLNRRAIDAMLTRTTGQSAQKAAQAAVERTKRNITASGRVKSGKMRDSITAKKISGTVTKCVYSVGSDLEYTAYQEFGIGAVQARAGGVLRFQPKGQSVFIFRPRTRGFEGAHFLRKTLGQVSVRDYIGAHMA